MLYPGIHGWFQIYKSIYLIHYISKLKEKIPQSHLITCRKVIDRNPRPLHDKNPREIRNTGTYLNVKGSLQQAYRQYQIKWRETQRIPLKSVIRQGQLISPYLFNKVLEVLGRLLKEIKGLHVRKEASSTIICR